MKTIGFKGALAALLCAGALVPAGCASHREVEVTKTESSEHEPATPAGEPVRTEAEKHERTTVVEREHDHPDRGFVGGVLHGIGQILAAPFRLIGALFEAIF